MSQHLEPREWKLRSGGRDAAEGFSEQELAAKVAELQAETGLSPMTLRVCVMRALDSAEAIREFLNPRFETLTQPGLIRDMDQAIDRLARARGENERVRIFGDYDVDGTSGAALLSWVFRDFGLSFDARQPDRFKDGYGLNVGAVESAAQEGIRLMVTVDCGITSFDAASRAHELGVDLIVVDHHQIDPARGLPEALAVINPQRTDCPSQLKQLCGCGLAFYLAMALRQRGRQDGWFAGGPRPQGGAGEPAPDLPEGAADPEGPRGSDLRPKEPNLKQHLDLVVMATAADMVPLTGDNHVLVRHGLEVLKNTRKPGVRALLEAAGLGARDISPGHLGFVIGPRINASGRMHSASLALELLTTTEPARAAELAHELERLNDERAQVQNQIWDEVRARVEKGITEGRFKHGIVVADPAWHEGVVGIVASRVTETFRRPAAVIALREDFGKGSVRSYGGKDVLSALRAASHTLLGFGGHKHAAGLSVEVDRVDELADAFDLALAAIEEDANATPLYLEGSCAIEDLDLKTLQELEHLGPFGPGNPEPVFSFKAAVKSHSVLKGRHLKLSLAPVGSARQWSAAGALSGRVPTSAPERRVPTIEAIWFHAAERPDVQGLLAGELPEDGAEWAGVPEINRFRGRMTPTFRVRDWRP